MGRLDNNKGRGQSYTTDQASSGICGLHGKVSRIDPIVHCKKHPSGGMQVLSQTFEHPPDLATIFNVWSYQRKIELLKCHLIGEAVKSSVQKTKDLPCFGATGQNVLRPRQIVS